MTTAWLMHHDKAYALLELGEFSQAAPG